MDTRQDDIRRRALQDLRRFEVVPLPSEARE